MPGVRTAAQIVRQTREHAQILDAGTYRDGFSTDPDTSSSLISVLSFVNQALSVFQRCGVLQSFFNITTASGTWRYAIPSGAGRITDVTYPSMQDGQIGIWDRPLHEVSIVELNSRDRFWRSKIATPNVYVSLGGEVYVFPVPSGVGPLTLRAEAVIPDLVLSSDSPTALPPHFHDAISLFAAMLLCASDAENPARSARLDFLMGLWNILYSDLDSFVKARSLFLPYTRSEAYQQRPEGDSNASAGSK